MKCLVGLFIAGLLIAGVCLISNDKCKNCCNIQKCNCGCEKCNLKEKCEIK